jgi:hypothetical protein
LTYQQNLKKGRNIMETTDPIFEGPFWDYNKITDYFDEQRNAQARGATRGLLENDLPKARWYAVRFQVAELAYERCGDRYDAIKHSDLKWIGYRHSDGRPFTAEQIVRSRNWRADLHSV